MIDNIKAKVLLADRGYDSDAIVEKAEKAGMKAVIPPRKNRKIQREYDKVFRQERIAKRNVNTTRSCTSYGTLSRMHS